MNAVTNYKAIGTKDCYFAGIYDGDDYKIKNLKITNNRTITGSIDFVAMYGLFGFISDATIKNVILEDLNIDIKLKNEVTSSMVIAEIGGITVAAYDSYITNCRVIKTAEGKSLIKVEQTDGELVGYGVGGIVGTMAGTKVEAVENQADITGNVAQKERQLAFGGIAFNEDTTRMPDDRVGYINNAINSGNITLTGGAVNGMVGFGGILGVGTGSNNSNTINIGKVDISRFTVGEKFEKYTGASMGQVNNPKTVLKDNFFLDTSAEKGCGENSDVPITDAALASKTDAQLKTAATFTGWDTTNTWIIKDGSYPTLKGISHITPPAPSYPGSGNNNNIPISANNKGNTDVATLKPGKNDDGQSLATIVMDQQKLDKFLADVAGQAPSGKPTVLSIPLPKNSSEVIRSELNGQVVKNMELKDVVHEIVTDSASYTIPAREINIDAISQQMGKAVTLSDIKVAVEIAHPTSDVVKVVESSAVQGGFSLVVNAIDFEVTCTYNGKPYDISDFISYVERTVTIPDGVDPKKITTGIVVDADGATRNVPTFITQIDGKYYAKINSMTNSTYSVIWNPEEFTDVANHWAKNAVNDMGSRLVVNGVSDGLFAPDENTTRAEFAAIIVRALGLKPGVGENKFSDVSSNSWYCDYVKIAIKYGIISGYDNVTFGPNDKITREQAMTMVARAMKHTSIKTDYSEIEISTLLSQFIDSANIAS